MALRVGSPSPRSSNPLQMPFVSYSMLTCCHAGISVDEINSMMNEAGSKL